MSHRPIDVMQGGIWSDWSSRVLAQIADREPVVINQIISAEVASGFDSREDLDEALSQALIEREDLPWEAGFLAARAFLDYRRRGGPRTSPLPDFYTGSHALGAGHALLTRDARRYRGYSPKLAEAEAGGDCSKPALRTRRARMIAIAPTARTIPASAMAKPVHSAFSISRSTRNTRR